MYVLWARKCVFIFIGNLKKSISFAFPLLCHPSGPPLRYHPLSRTTADAKSQLEKEVAISYTTEYREL